MLIFGLLATTTANGDGDGGGTLIHVRKYRWLKALDL